MTVMNALRGASLCLLAWVAGCESAPQAPPDAAPPNDLGGDAVLQGVRQRDGAEQAENPIHEAK